MAATVASPASAGEGPRALWVSWNPHRRSTGLSNAWGVPLQVLVPRYKGMLRWFELPLVTLGRLRRVRPEILFVPSPSLALSALAVLCRPLFSYLLVIDAHNEGVRPYDRQGAFVRWLTNRLLRQADITLITNDALATDVRAAGGRPLILPDALPTPPAPGETTRANDRSVDVAVVATFRRDEPIVEIIEAARRMPNVRFAFSGDSTRFDAATRDLPSNVRLTGFLADRDYWQLLREAAVVCDLTLKSDCLVCGAYEALALGKAMVLSDNPATRELFGPAAALAGDGVEDIEAALRLALREQTQLQAGARDVAATYQVRWASQAESVWQEITVRLGQQRGGLN